MNGKPNYALVGLFVILLGLALIAGVLWLGFGWPREEHGLYLSYMSESVSGLSRDAEVRYRGVDVGRVRDIRIDPQDPQRVILLLEIRRGTPVKQDTVAVLEMQGLTGLSKINLAGGSRESPPLATEAGEPYPVIRSAPSLFGRLELSLSRLLENVNHSSQRLNELLNDRNLHAFSRAMEHVEVLSGTLAAGSGTLETIMNDLAATLENTRAASAQLPATVKRMNAAAGALERMADEIAQAAHTLRASGDELGRFAGQSLPEATATVEELHQAAANLRRLSERLERNPSILLFGETRAMPGPGE